VIFSGQNVSDGVIQTANGFGKPFFGAVFDMYSLVYNKVIYAADLADKTNSG
jgi:hypothetical protein